MHCERLVWGIDMLTSICNEHFKSMLIQQSLIHFCTLRWHKNFNNSLLTGWFESDKTKRHFDSEIGGFGVPANWAARSTADHTGTDFQPYAFQLRWAAWQASPIISYPPLLDLVFWVLLSDSSPDAFAPTSNTPTSSVGRVLLSQTNLSL